MKKSIIKKPERTDLKYWIEGYFMIAFYASDLEKYIKYLEKQIK